MRARARAASNSKEGKPCDVESGPNDGTLSFDSEVLAAFTFVQHDLQNSSGNLGLHVIARAASDLAPIPGLQHMPLPQLTTPSENWLSMTPLPSNWQDAATKPWTLPVRNTFGYPFPPEWSSGSLIPLSKRDFGMWPNDSNIGNHFILQHSHANGPKTPVLVQWAVMFVLGALGALVVWRTKDSAGTKLHVCAGEWALVECGTFTADPLDVDAFSAGGPQEERQAAECKEPTVGATQVQRQACQEELRSPDSDSPVGLARVPPQTTLGHSLRNGHFQATFADAALIGVGGFGSVYQAMHRLEGGWYAVKLIALDGLDGNEAIRTRRDFGEVLNLRRLIDSRHIVRYFTCWCEEPQFLPQDVADIDGIKGASGSGHGSSRVDGDAARGQQQAITLGGASSSNLSSRYFPSCPYARSEGHDVASSGDETYHASGYDSQSSCAITFEAESGIAGNSALLISSGGPACENAAHAQCQRADSCGGNRQAANDCPAELPPQRSAYEAAADCRKPRFQTVLMIQMELCTGPTLREWMDRRRCSRTPLSFVRGHSGEALELVFAKHLMKGIRAIHAADMVHRDLKPQNIFVTHEDVLKIGDFGLSRHACDLHDIEKGKVGTPAYCAPEGGINATSSADIFSAALIILELLCPPFTTSMERVTVLQAFRERSALPPHVDERLPHHAGLLRKMASHNPDDRPTAEEVHQTLKRLGIGGALEPIPEASSSLQ